MTGHQTLDRLPPQQTKTQKSPFHLKRVSQRDFILRSQRERCRQKARRVLFWKALYPRLESSRYLGWDAKKFTLRRSFHFVFMSHLTRGFLFLSISRWFLKQFPLFCIKFCNCIGVFFLNIFFYRVKLLSNSLSSLLFFVTRILPDMELCCFNNTLGVIWNIIYSLS